MVMHNLSVAGNFTMVSPEYDGGPFDGKVTPEVPDHMFNVNVDYDPMPGLGLNFSVQRVGEINDNATNTVVLDPYTLFNAKAKCELAIDKKRSYKPVVLVI